MATVEGVNGAYALVVTRWAALDATCAPIAGADQANIMASLETSSTSDEVREGAEYEKENGDGNLEYVVRKDDSVKWINHDIEMATLDFEGLALITSGQLIANGTGDPIGIERQGGCEVIPLPTVSREIWTRTGSNCGECLATGVASAGVEAQIRIVHPAGRYSMGDAEFGNDVVTFNLTGRSWNNPSWGDGPFNDYPSAAPLGANTLESIVYDATLPVAAKGLAVVPAQ